MAIPRSVLVLASLLFGAHALGGLRKHQQQQPVYEAAVTTTLWHSVLSYPDLFKFMCPESNCADMSGPRTISKHTNLTADEKTNGRSANVSEIRSSCKECGFRCTAFTTCSVQLRNCREKNWLAEGSNTSSSVRQCNLATCLEHCPCSSSTLIEQTEYYVGSPKMCHNNCLRNWGRKVYEGQLENTIDPDKIGNKATNRYDNHWRDLQPGVSAITKLKSHARLALDAIEEERKLAKCLVENLKDGANNLYFAAGDVVIPSTQSGDDEWYPGPR